MIKLYNNDCLKILPTLSDHSVDMILADLPYGTTRNRWDSLLPFDELWKQYERLLKVGGVVALFGDEPFASKLRMSNKKWYRYDWYWTKNNATGFLNANRMPLKRVETISIFYPKLPLYNPQKEIGYKPYTSMTGSKTKNYGKFKSIKTVNDGSRYPTNVLTFNKVNKTIHPTQKPVDLLEYLIKTYTNEGMTVLDNVMGSGSTGVACKNLNRNFIGIEKDPDYFKLAKERLDGNVD